MRKLSETTQNNIVAAAYDLFVEKGYAATSMESIAAKAGVAKQTIYGYFPDKRALFTAVIERAVGTPWKLDAQSATITSKDDLGVALYKIVSGINNVSMQPRYIKLLRTIVSESGQQPELGDLFRKGVTYQSLQYLTALFTDSNEAGITAIANPQLAARFFLGGIVVRIFLDGLLANTTIKKLSEDELHEYVAVFIGCVISHT